MHRTGVLTDFMPMSLEPTPLRSAGMSPLLRRDLLNSGRVDPDDGEQERHQTQQERDKDKIVP